MNKIIKGLASGLVIAGMAGMLSTTVVRADWSTRDYNFWFDVSSGDAYCYSEPQSKDNDSSSYIYYRAGGADVIMSIVGYDDGYVFGGHEIDVDVNSKGEMVCAEMR